MQLCKFPHSQILSKSWAKLRTRRYLTNYLLDYWGYLLDPHVVTPDLLLITYTALSWIPHLILIPCTIHIDQKNTNVVTRMSELVVTTSTTLVQAVSFQNVIICKSSMLGYHPMAFGRVTLTTTSNNSAAGISCSITTAWQQLPFHHWIQMALALSLVVALQYCRWTAWSWQRLLSKSSLLTVGSSLFLNQFIASLWLSLALIAVWWWYCLRNGFPHKPWTSTL